MTTRQVKRGERIAVVLRGCWRRTPPALSITQAELEEAAPALLNSGGAALGWRRIHDSALTDSPAASQLRDAARLYLLQSAIRQREIREVFRLLRAAGVEPVVVKGWALSRLYLEEGLRPSGDIDLCVRPQQLSTAHALLKTPQGRTYNVDFEHAELGALSRAGWEEFYARSQTTELDGVEIRVPSAEDHLRLLCVHLLRHGAWRPLWLCDVALALETRPANFDWPYCLGENPRAADWIACALGLAHQLLDARLDDTPVAPRARRLPGWLVPQVLKCWGSLADTAHAPEEILSDSLRHPARLPRALLARWPDPVKATVSLDRDFNELPRLPFQLGEYLRLCARFILRQTRSTPEQP